MRDIIRIALDGAKKYNDYQFDLLKRFSEIDHGTGNTEGNAAVIAVMKPVLESLGAEVTLVPNRVKGGHHVVARIRPEGAASKIIINSHIDTVFKPGDAAAHPLRIDGEWAYGLGIADCMAGFVVSTHAVKIMQEAGLLPDKEIVMIYNNDEEIGSPSGREVFKEESEGAEMAFVFEPAREEDGILTYRKGVAVGKIEVTGKEAHAGLKYEEGRSATVELAHQIVNLSSMNVPEKGMFYNVGPLTGGSSIGVVAGHASAEFAVSPPDMASYEKVCEDMKQLETHVTIDGCTVKAQTELIFPVMDHTEGNVRVYELVRAAGEKLGMDLPEQASGGSSDACYFSTYGVPTVDAMGPYMYDIHTFNERLRIADIEKKTALFAVVLASL